MSGLWSASEATLATGGRATGEWVAHGVSIDTRSLAPGDLFVALKDQRDGHDFVADALARGAAAALVDHVPDGVDQTAPLLIVDDTQEGLRGLASAARDRTQASVVGVTGSVGKTSTKEMLRTALGALGRVHAAEKSFNNHWGVPLTLARMPKDTDYAVIEIGMNHPGEIAPLARLARLDVAMVTTVAAVHLEAFGQIEGIAREKASIIEGLVPGGTLVMNADFATRDIVRGVAQGQGARIVTFGQDPEAEFPLLSVGVHEAATTAQTRLGDAPLAFKIGAPGRHLAVNALGVLAAVSALGADVPRAALALASWHAFEGRGTRWDIALGPGGIDGRIHLIDESYNANPAAMAAALEVFATVQPEDGIGRVARGRRIAFLTDMLELGPKASQMHGALADLPAMDQVDQVHCAGPMMQALHHALPRARQGEWHPDSTALAARVRRLVDAGDVVMCKGSLGSRAGIVVEAVKKLGAAQRRHASGAGVQGE